MTLLDERLKEHDLPPPPYEPFGETVLVYPLPEDKAKRETFIPGGVLVKAESMKSREEKESPRGILVGAGLRAMDYLRGYHIELGHIVWIARLSPWRHVVEVRSDGTPLDMFFMNASDIKGSEDVARMRRDGTLRLTVDAEGVHRFENDSGALPRFEPPTYNA
jgi:hypothetical protein